MGKYDTYKGSTLDKVNPVHVRNYKENMILIKDRHRVVHPSGRRPPVKKNMILIKDRHTHRTQSICVHVRGKYDTYKGFIDIEY